MSSKNIYMPFEARIKDVIETRCDVKLFRVLPSQKIDYLPGQFFMVSRWGAGEVPISVTSTMGIQKHIEFGIKKVGSVTSSLHKLKKGDTIWLRGPYGNGFGADTAKKRDIVFIAGGVGVVPLRSLINFILMHKNHYGKISLLYGAKNPFEVLFEEDIKEWNKKGVDIILTVDVKDKTWKGNTGFVTEHIDKIKAGFKNSCAYICGPEIMIKRTMEELSSRGMPDTQIITTLEARMKCGIGKCGQCYHGTEYVCTNGPIFSYRDIKQNNIGYNF